MIEILKIHLQECFAPEEATLIEQVIEEMAKMNVDSDDYYTNLFNEWEQGAVDDLNGAIRVAVATDATNTLAAHGVYLNESATLADHLTFLQFFAGIEDYESPQLIYDIIRSDEIDDVEALASAIQELTARDAVLVMACIDTITSNVVNNLKEYCKERIFETPLDNTEEAESAVLAKSLKSYADLVEGHDMVCYKHVFEVEGVVGLPMMLYWSTYNSYLTSIPEQAMLFELIGFALISDEADKNPADVIAPVLSLYFGDDIDKIAMAKSSINQIIIELRGAISTNALSQRTE